jgi:hypothetical protein
MLMHAWSFPKGSSHMPCTRELLQCIESARVQTYADSPAGSLCQLQQNELARTAGAHERRMFVVDPITGETVPVDEVDDEREMVREVSEVLFTLCCRGSDH